MRVFYTKTITVYRLTIVSNATEGYVQYGDIKGSIFPLTAESAFLTEGNPSQSYKLMADYNTDIKKTDKVNHNGTDYIVTGIQRFDFGAMRRTEALLEKFNS